MKCTSCGTYYEMTTCGCYTCVCGQSHSCYGPPIITDGVSTIPLSIPIKKTKHVIVSGFFNPIHSGHISMIRNAAQLGDRLTVIVNSDKQVGIKGSTPFMSESERSDIVLAIKGVDVVMVAIDEDGTVAETLQRIAQSAVMQELIFAKGGDRKDDSCMPLKELEVCQKYNIQVVYGVGGFVKMNSSSEILRNIGL